MGHEVHVITGVPSHPAGRPFPGYHLRWYFREVQEGIIVHRVLTYLAPNRGTFRRLANYLSFVPSAVWRASRLGDFDIILATSPQFFCAVAGWMASSLKKCPWVFELRDLWPESVSAVGALNKSLLLKAVEKWELGLYRSAAGVACVTRSFLDNLEARGIDRGKCVFIPNGIVPEEWEHLDGSEIRRRHGFLPSHILVSYIGTVGMAHGLEVVLQAAAILSKKAPEVRFLIVGDGARLAGLQKMAKDLGIASVVFTGLVSHVEAKAYLAASDIILVHLKKTELFKTVLPSKMFEAMAAGKPILLAVEGEAKEVLRRSGAGESIPPEDPESLAESVVRLLGDPVGRKQMGHSGKAFVRKEFSRRFWAQEYERWLAGLLNGQGGDGADGSKNRKAAGKSALA